MKSSSENSNSNGKHFFLKLFDFCGGLFAGAALWFISGLLIYWFWALLPSSFSIPSSSGAFIAFHVAIVVFLVYSVAKRRGVNYFVMGMLSFIASGLLLPGPCSIYSLTVGG